LQAEAKTPRHVTSEEFDFRYSFAAEELSRILGRRQKQLCSIPHSYSSWHRSKLLTSI